MKNSVFFEIVIRIAILFTIGMFGTFISEGLQSSGFFGDVAVTGSSGGVDQSYEWGARHYWYFWMVLLIFCFAFINLIVAIVNIIQKHYPNFLKA